MLKAADTTAFRAGLHTGLTSMSPRNVLGCSLPPSRDLRRTELSLSKKPVPVWWQPQTARYVFTHAVLSNAAGPVARSTAIYAMSRTAKNG